MDEEVGSHRAGVRDASPPSAAGRLTERLGELRRRLEVLAPEDRDRSREAIELIRQAQERIAVLEEMLAAARGREDELTAQLVGDHMKVVELETRVGDLRAVAERVSEAEGARLRAETEAAEVQQLLAGARADVEAKQADVERLRSRCADLEADLTTMADELATSTVARARAARLERERDIARERARTEGRIALEDRLRAADAERQADLLRGRLREAEQRLARAELGDVAATEGSAATGAAPLAEETTSASGHEGSGDRTEDGTTVVIEDGSDEDADVIDLTEEPGGSADADEAAEGYEAEEVLVWAAPERPGRIMGWLRRGLLGEDDREDDDDEED